MQGGGPRGSDRDGGGCGAQLADRGGGGCSLPVQREHKFNIDIQYTTVETPPSES
jgi:hypothetical protein